MRRTRTCCEIVNNSVEHSHRHITRISSVPHWSVPSGECAQYRSRDTVQRSHAAVVRVSAAQPAADSDLSTTTWPHTNTAGQLVSRRFWRTVSIFRKNELSIDILLMRIAEFAQTVERVGHNTKTTRSFAQGNRTILHSLSSSHLSFMACSLSLSYCCTICSCSSLLVGA